MTSYDADAVFQNICILYFQTSMHPITPSTSTRRSQSTSPPGPHEPLGGTCEVGDDETAAQLVGPANEAQPEEAPTAARRHAWAHATAAKKLEKARLKAAKVYQKLLLKSFIIS